MIEIGSRVKDKINGFEGIVTGRTDYLFGCRSLLVAPEALDDKGQPCEALWLDEYRLEVVAAEVFQPVTRDDAVPMRVPTGGDRDDHAPIR